MKYRACIVDVEDFDQCPVVAQVWVQHPPITLDTKYFPNLSPPEVYTLGAAIMLLFAVAFAWKSAGRSIRD